MQSTSLPSHRALLTNLIASFYARSQSGLDAAQDDANPATTSAVHNDQRRRLLLTLHVIFPGMLLPAVDLLDRKLVTRMTFVEAAAARPVSSSQGDDAADEPAAPDTPETISVYAVKSVYSTLSRRRRDAATAGPPRTYLVHLDAWNCSCAGFALEAFPGGGGDVEGTGEALGENGNGEEGWTFGGMSRDDGGRWGETLPCCKHLLACLLADKWRDVLNVHVEDKTCTREELAGIAAGL